MEIRYLLGIIRRYFRLLAAAGVVGCLLATAAAYVLPERFESDTSILIRPRRVPTTTPSSSAMMDYPVSFNIPVDSMSKTYAQIMTSEAVATRVVDLLRLDMLTPPRDPRWWVRFAQVARDDVKIALVRTWEFLRYGRIERKTPYREAVDNVLAGIKAEPVTDTFLFSLKASARDPKLAAIIANTAATVFIEYTRRARIDEESTGARDIAERMTTVRRQLEDARTKLQAFGDGTSAASLDHQLQLEMDELSKLAADREETVRELAAARAESDTLRRQISSQDAAVTSSTTVMRNPVVTETETALARYEVEYAGLAATLQPDHPRMLELRARIDEARRSLASAKAQIPDRDTSTLNATREQITQRLLDRVAVTDARKASLTALDQSIARYRDDIAALTGQKGDLARLSLDVDVLENEYRLLNRQEAETRLAAEQQVGEIRQLHEALPPIYPTRPIKIYYAAAGLVMGLVLALLAVLLVDYTDPTVYDHADMHDAFNVPLLAVVQRAPAGHALEAGSGDRVAAQAHRVVLR